MEFSEEFLQQRSFEVVWATFRVAEHISREKLAKSLEDKALDYFATKSMGTLDALEEFVRLAHTVGEISRVNAKVLIREIGNLRAALVEIGEREIELLPESGEQTLDVSYMFSDRPHSQRIPQREERQESGKREAVHSKAKEEESAEIKDRKESGNSPAESGKESLADKKEDKNEMPESGNREAIVRQESGNNVEKSGRYEVDAGKQYIGATKDERKAIIIGLLKKRNLCHINDVVSTIAGVSPRTIRGDIKEMVESDQIERIGSGGPNSFFRLKKTSEVS